MHKFVNTDYTIKGIIITKCNEFHNLVCKIALVGFKDFIMLWLNDN